MADFYDESGWYGTNTPIYDKFNYFTENHESVTLIPRWTSSGLLVPITSSETPVYMRIPREECIKMLGDLLNIDDFVEAFKNINIREENEELKN